MMAKVIVVAPHAETATCKPIPDSNPASVTKLLDRVSSQAVGVVSDIGTFLSLLAEELEKLNDT